MVDSQSCCYSSMSLFYSNPLSHTDTLYSLHSHVKKPHHLSSSCHCVLICSKYSDQRYGNALLGSQNLFSCINFEPSLHVSIMLCWLRSHSMWPFILCSVISVYCTPSNIRCLLELYVRSSFPCSISVNIYSAASAVDTSLHQSVLLLLSVGQRTSDSDSN